MQAAQSQPQALPLRDIHIPDAIGLWPPAIGWWILAILIPIILYLLWRSVRFITRKTALKSAKKQFKALKINTKLTAQQRLIALSQLIRRTAISLNADKAVASLTGQGWLAFLNSSLTSPVFNDELGRLLTEGLYQSHIEDDNMTQLVEACEQWLQQQKEPKK